MLASGAVLCEVSAMEQLSTYLGLLGVGLILLAYGALQLGRLANASLAYSLLNIVGSLLILVSLIYQWNLPSFVIQVSWIAITLAGLFRRWQAGRK